MTERIKMRILFAGSPKIAIPCLQALLDSEDEIVGVLSQPDRPVGRGQELQSPAIAQFAKDNDLPLIQAEKIKTPEFLKTVQGLKPDLMVVIAYGRILTQQLLDVPKKGCINIHFSLLPKYRGAAPVHWALINDEIETGVTSMVMSEEMDAGDILLQKKMQIQEEDTVTLLSDRLANVGADLLMETIDRMKAGDLVQIPQDSLEVSFAPLLKKTDGQIDWTCSAKEIACKVRGMNPWPSAFTFVPGTGTGEKKRLKIFLAERQNIKTEASPGEVILSSASGLKIACGRRVLELLEVQIEGGKRLPVAEFLKGHALALGTKLG